MQLWFNRNNEPGPSEPHTLDNVVVLSEAFYHEISGHPIPVEREVIAALAHAPGLLDFYILDRLEKLDGSQLSSSHSDLRLQRPLQPTGHR